MAYKQKKLKCILLIDDDDPTNYIHQTIIQKSGLEVHVEAVTGGQEGLDFLTSSGRFSDQKEFPTPGIIFLDINMPGMNGWEFLEEYEKLPEEIKAQVVVAMLTTSINPNDEAQASKIKSINGFMNKPLTKEMLYKIIEKHFDIELIKK